MKIFKGEKYLSLAESSALLGISPKTFRRCAERGEISRRIKGGWETVKLDIEAMSSPITGYHYYRAKSVEDAAERFFPGYVRLFSSKEEPLFYEI